MFFGDVRQKISDGKTGHPPSYRQFFSILDIFWNTEVSPKIFFDTKKQKNFDTKSRYTPLVNKIFQNPKKVKP